MIKKMCDHFCCAHGGIVHRRPCHLVLSLYYYYILILAFSLLLLSLSQSYLSTLVFRLVSGTPGLPMRNDLKLALNFLQFAYISGKERSYFIE